MKNYTKLIENLVKTESSLRNANTDLLTYWTELNSVITELKKLKKTVEIASLKLDITDKCKISDSTFEKRMSMLNSAIKKGLNPIQYTSFNSLEKAKGNIVKGTHRATKKGTIIADKKGYSEKLEKVAVVQATNVNEISQLMANESFRKFKIEFEEKGYKLANVMKALKS